MSDGSAVRAAAATSDGDRRLPVFLYPSNHLCFVVDQPSGHKQVLTLYNPYEFPLAYKVLSTGPKKYSVGEPEGVLKARCCLDIVIRHLAIAVKSNIGKADKFRILIRKYGEEDVCGRKDVTATLFRSQEEARRSTSDRLDDDSSPFERPTSGVGQPSVGRSASSRGRAQTSGDALQYGFPPECRPVGVIESPSVGVGRGPGALVLLAGLLCLVALTLPTSGDQSPRSLPIPDYLHLSQPQKLVAAYILGLVTMIMIRLN